MKQTNSTQKLGLILAACGLLTHNASALVMMETVPVGNAGNIYDENHGYGAVGYIYHIGKYEVTLNQYTEFLNAVGATDTYGLYNAQMGQDTNIMGIARSGTSGSYSYSVLGSGNRPVTYVSWYDAARFANWLHNGQPTGAQDATTTEEGAYTLTGNTGLITRNAGWVYALPSEDEWFKAAYHQPFEQGGTERDYWYYPTRSDAVPNSRPPSSGDTNSGNFYFNDLIANGYNGGYALNNSIGLPSGGALTDVGAYSVAYSYYGTFDQAGNVEEWNDAVIGSARGYRGGGWPYQHNRLHASFRPWTVPPTYESQVSGFRVVMLPPQILLNVSQSGGALTFSWAGNFKLQVQTNSLSVGNSTNWLDYPLGGSSPVIHNIDPANPAVFFRLSSP